MRLFWDVPGNACQRANFLLSSDDGRGRTSGPLSSPGSLRLKPPPRSREEDVEDVEEERWLPREDCMTWMDSISPTTRPGRFDIVGSPATGALVELPRGLLTTAPSSSLELYGVDCDPSAVLASLRRHGLLKGTTEPGLGDRLRLEPATHVLEESGSDHVRLVNWLTLHEIRLEGVLLDAVCSSPDNSELDEVAKKLVTEGFAWWTG